MVKKKIPYTSNECDIIVLVALDRRLCHFMLPNNNKSKKMYINKMTIENEQQTFNEVIGDVKHGDHTIFVGEVKFAILYLDGEALNLSSTGWSYGG